MAMRLVLYNGDQKLAVEVRDGKYVLGRDANVEITIPNPTVSTRHAELTVQGDRCVLRDLGSSNGTFINGTRLQAQAAQPITPRDDVRLASARIAIESLLQPASDAGVPTAQFQSYRPPEVSVSQALPLKPVKPPRPWHVAVFLAGVVAIVTLVALMFFIEAYSQDEAKRSRLTGRYATLAAQYIHALEQSPAPALPKPIHDEWLQPPIYVLDRTGKPLYPPPQPGDTGRPPLVGKNGAIPDPAKLGLYSFKFATGKGEPLRLKSYPITSGGGEILGYVVAQPGEGFTNLPLIALMIVCAAAIALLVLYYALRPVTSGVRREVSELQEKVPALAAGFVKALPRSARVPELAPLADEIEARVHAAQASAAPRSQSVEGGGDPYLALMPALIDAAHLPLCFISNEFHLLSSNDAFKTIAELAAVRRGTSVFDSGMTNLQSKQVIRAINDARSQSEGRAETNLTSGGETRNYEVIARRFRDPMRNEAMFGLLLRAL